jgi:hypothetical protein
LVCLFISFHLYVSWNPVDVGMYVHRL